MSAIITILALMAFLYVAFKVLSATMMLNAAYKQAVVSYRAYAQERDHGIDVNKVAYLREFYNIQASSYNMYRQKFPANMIAELFRDKFPILALELLELPQPGYEYERIAKSNVDAAKDDAA